MSLASDLAFVRQLFHERAGVELDEEKNYLVETRLAMVARSERLDGLSELVRRLRRGSDAHLATRVVDALLIHETSFFRDIYPFEMLREVVLPDLVQRRDGERRLHIWCAACASGQEPYSVAMVLRSSQQPKLDGWDLRIAASDLSAPMVARTQAGAYSQLEVNRGLPIQMLLRFFAQRDRDWVVKPELREMVEARQFNLIEECWGVQQVDVLFLRNVLIYLDQSHRQRVLEKAHRALRSDGYMFLGGAETLLSQAAPFERVLWKRGISYRPR